MNTLKTIWQNATPEQKQRIRDRLDDELEVVWRGVRVALEGDGTNPTIYAPCCNRPRPADCLLDIRPIARATRVDYLTRAGIRNVEAVFICDGCLGRAVRLGVVKRWRVFQAVGASADIVNGYKAIEGA